MGTQETLLSISQASKLTELTAKSIRLYEEKGILSPPVRGENGYRYYTQHHIDELRLIARAKRVGFSLEECKALVLLSNDPNRESVQVRDRAKEKLHYVQNKISELKLMEQQLQQWIAECPGDKGSHCPIIDDLTR